MNVFDNSEFEMQRSAYAQKAKEKWDGGVYVCGNQGVLQKKETSVFD